MKIILVLTICVLTTGHRTIRKSDLLIDAREIMKVLKTTVTLMEPLSRCFAKTARRNVTLEEKQRCLAILTELQKPGKNRLRKIDQQRNTTRWSVRPGQTRLLRNKCRSFHRRSC